MKNDFHFEHNTEIRVGVLDIHARQIGEKVAPDHTSRLDGSRGWLEGLSQQFDIGRWLLVCFLQKYTERHSN